jgi:formylglycine-generating enzyme required for sulfatase activity
MYAWGNEEPDTTRSCYMHQGGSCPVASYPAGGFGLFDMTGNVWEWTSSWFAPYPHEPADGQFKVYRGGQLEPALREVDAQRLA